MTRRQRVTRVKEITKINREIEMALHTLGNVCGFLGESGTESMFYVLCEAIELVQTDWWIVEKSHKDGLCYNVDTLLADAIVKVLSKRELLEAGSQDHPIN